jgi:NAD+ synthase (glutamine-hydrolysing)
MAGGFAPIKDVPKTLVYDLVRWRNGQATGEPPIPERVVTKPPSAELRPDQRDTDSLPPYEVLDPILEAYVEEDRSPEELVASGIDAAVVDAVVMLVDRAEYKRRQAAPGIKITPKAFGRDRRMPITNRYRSTRLG